MNYNYAQSLKELEAKMSACEQMPGLSVYDHGLMVSLTFSDMIEELERGLHQEEFLQSSYELLKEKLLDAATLRRYHVYHDCGKPFCQPTEEKKFPEHEVRSFEQWKLIFPEDRKVAELMLNDMRFHVGQNEDAFYLSDITPSLYFTAWAELYANSEMFGGQETTSFKIKKKRLIQQGKKLLKAFE